MLEGGIFVTGKINENNGHVILLELTKNNFGQARRISSLRQALVGVDFSTPIRVVHAAATQCDGMHMLAISQHGSAALLPEAGPATQRKCRNRREIGGAGGGT